MKAGAAKIDITPRTNVWMDGMIRAHPSEGIHDPLFARALVLSDGEDLKRACAIVSIDVAGLRQQEMDTARQAVDRWRLGLGRWS